MKRVSFDEFLSSVSVSLLHVSSNLSVFVPGIHIACVYDDNWFLGNILKIRKEKPGHSGPIHILCKVISLKVKSAAGRCNHISSTEHREILNLFENFMKMSSS